jgi:hypothetical protein
MQHMLYSLVLHLSCARAPFLMGLFSYTCSSTDFRHPCICSSSYASYMPGRETAKQTLNR